MKYLFAIITLAASIVACQTGCSPRHLTAQEAIVDANAALADGDTTRAERILESRVNGDDPTPAEFVLLGEIHRNKRTIRDRMESQHVLEAGLADYPDDPDILAALGKTYYDQTFFGDAQREFERVLELDPDNCVARYYLGSNAYRKWKRVQLYTDYLGEAIDHLSLAVACSPQSDRAFFKLAFSRYAIGDTTFVLRTCDEYSRFHPEDPNPDFIRGLILFEQERLEACWKRFSRALDMLDDEEYFEYRDIAMLITGEALESYELAGKEQRRELQRLFWLQQDPDPTTEINERFLEHVYRVYQAKIRYTLDSPSIDGRLSERGRALIKFGWPTHMRTTLGGGLSPADGRMEIWNYFIPPRGFTLYFRDEFLNGNYIVPMDYGYSYSAQTLFNAPPITDIIPETILVPGALDVVAFRDSDLACSVFVSFAIDADSLSGATWTWDVDSFVARTAFYDRSGRPQVRGADTLTADALPAHPGPHGNDRTVIRSFELPFDDYLVAFCFEDELGLTQSIHWSETNTVKYLPDELTVSDILFELPHSLRQDAATFSRSGLALTPNPSRAYPPGRTVDTYVEIYNLGLSGLVSDYEVTYSIHPVKGAASRWEAIGRGLKWLVRMSSDPDPALSQTLSRTGTTYTARERLAINIDELAPGNYMLSIAVHDKTTGERAVASKVFTKLDWR